MSPRELSLDARDARAPDVWLGLRMSVYEGAAAAGAPPVDVVPLGGLGEFGLNMMAISCGETTIVIDAGAMFPETDLPGVDLIVPDLAYLDSRKGQLKAVVVRTPQGVLLHTGDFKVDQTPIDGEAFDLHRFAQLGSEGVLAMFCDSTNIDRRGYTGSEADVEDAFEEIFTSTEGKIIVSTFSSSLYRLQIVVDLAAQFDRKVAFVGRGMIQNAEIAQRLGFLHVPTGVSIKDSDVQYFPAQDVVCLATGSQGEANAALSRIAIDDHRFVSLKEGDRVVIAARPIPGNEKAIGRVMNHLARRGVDIVTESQKHVHVSGHGSEEELKLVLSLVRPKYFIPVHGEYRQLAQHARVAKFVTRGLPSAVSVITAEDGDVIRFDI